MPNADRERPAREASVAREPFVPSVPRGRLAPSPTGNLHLGNAFAFLAAWLSARSRGGSLVLRMEDIDPERSRPSFAEAIVADLLWLGLDWDEGPETSGAPAASRGGPVGPYTQSLRLERYADFLDGLTGRGLCYPCYCTRKDLRGLASAPHIGDEGVPYPGTCRKLDDIDRARLESAGRRACIRLDVERALADLNDGVRPARRRLSFIDAVLGRQEADNCGGDFALRRSDGVFAYQLAVTCDDAAMGVTEVVRGADLLPSAPRQILLFRLLGAVPPVYGHLPLVRDALGERLAKRHKSLTLAALRAAGVDSRAVCGRLAAMAGWLPEARLAAPAELLPSFSLKSLRGRELRLPEDVPGVLKRL